MGFHHQPPRKRIRLALTVLLGAAALPVPAAAAPEPCTGDRCLVVEHEPALAAEAVLVVEALSRKFADHQVRVVADGEGRYRRFEEQPAVAGANGTVPRTLWIAHLRAIPPDWLLLTVAGPDPAGHDGAVRELRRSADPAETSRTIVLIIEEVVLAHLTGDADQAPLGAGLAIIEPPEVAGVKVSRQPADRPFPHLRAIELGLAGCYLAAADGLIAGPRLRLEGAAARNVAVSIAAGWAGTARFSGAGVTGTASAVPIEAQVNVLFLPGRIVELSAGGGFSMGFAVYRTSGDEEQRTDILFDPWFVLGLRAVLRIHGPWAVAVDGGGALVLMRDDLVNSGRAVYLQDWILPRLGLAVQLLL
ncbi:MAG TPA: hypothetical protein VM285_08225 [Polyangia bacterium]|nr:hypothetical protein [Polyangia bacterium]